MNSIQSFVIDLAIPNVRACYHVYGIELAILHLTFTTRQWRRNWSATERRGWTLDAAATFFRDTQVLQEFLQSDALGLWAWTLTLPFRKTHSFRSVAKYPLKSTQAPNRLT